MTNKTEENRQRVEDIGRLEFLGGYYGAAYAGFFTEEGTEELAWKKTGYSLGEVSQKLLLSLLFEEGEPVGRQVLIRNEGKPGEECPQVYSALRKAGINSLFASVLVEEGELQGYLLLYPVDKMQENPLLFETFSQVFSDKAARRKRIKRQKYELGHDVLTGTYNKTSYIEYMQQMGEMDSFGILCADVNGLKEINADYGFEYGNRVIKEIAQIIMGCFPDYPVFRFDGDDFMVCCRNIGRDDFYRRVEQLQNILDQNETGASIGCVWDDYDVEGRRMSRHAEELMLLEKNKYYENCQDENAKQKKQMIEGIKNYIRQGNFRVFLQPKVDINTGDYHGAEALIRLYHEEQGLVPPVKFIPVMERTGTVRYIDLFVFEEVCKMLQRWKDNGHELYPVSFNFSRATLLEKGLVARVKKILECFDFPRELLEVEITETIGEMEGELVARIAAELHNLGMKLSMDDFGTKYSNIATLSVMNFDILKIDRSMVNDIEHNETSRKIVHHVIEMCHDIGMDCIAEGVENETQVLILGKMNLNIVQGFFYGKPVEMAEFEKKICHQNKKHQ